MQTPVLFTHRKPQRAWCFTLNNPTIEEKVLIDNYEKARYIVYQKEIGENGTPHYQGYVELKKPQRLAGMKKWLARARFAEREGTPDQARDYCMKEDTRVEGPFEIGEWEKHEGKRTDLLEIKRKIDEGATMTTIADEHFGSFLRYERGFLSYKRLKAPKRSWKTEVIVMVGHPGAGKSHYCREQAPDAYYKQNGKWWDGYDEHADVIMDDFYGWLPWSVLLNVLDAYPLLVETKGGNVNFVARRVFITSNIDPARWYDYEKEHINLGALLRRVTKYIGCKILDGERIHQEFTEYQPFSNYIGFTTISEFPHSSI